MMIPMYFDPLRYPASADREATDVLTRLGPTIDPEDDYQRYVKGANILASLYGAK